MIEGGKLSKYGKMAFRECLKRDVVFPVTEDVIRRYRYVGPKVIKEFINAGMVIGYKTDELIKLSTRAYNCLVVKAELKSKSDIIEAIQSRKVYPLIYPRDYGWKTHEEVCSWAGLPKPIRPAPVNPLPRCPTCGRVLHQESQRRRVNGWFPSRHPASP